jgi:hypothetical protein
MAELQNSSKSAVTENLGMLSHLPDTHDASVQESFNEFTKAATSAITVLQEKLANEQSMVLAVTILKISHILNLDCFYFRIYTIYVFNQIVHFFSKRR